MKKNLERARVTDFHWLSPDEQRVFGAYGRAAWALFLQFDRELQAELGLPRSYFEILWLLHKAPNGAMRMSDLAARSGSQASRITHAVGSLEKAGQVRREHCAEDRRGWNAVITDAGREMLDRAAPRYAQMIRRHFFAPLSEGEREQIAGISQHLLDDLDRARTTLFEIRPASTTRANQWIASKAENETASS